MSTIYLISPSIYKDSISMAFYATDDAGIKKAIKLYVKEFGDNVVEPSFNIDYENEIVTFTRIDFGETLHDSYTCTFHLFPIPSI